MVGERGAVLRREDLGEAAEKFAQGVGLRLRGMVCGEQLEDLVADVRALFDGRADGGVLLVDDGVAAPSMRTSGGMRLVRGTTFPENFKAYPIARESGWQGTGIKSSGLKWLV